MKRADSDQKQRLETVEEKAISENALAAASVDTGELDSLPEKYKAIFGSLPDGRPVSFDEVLALCKTPGEAMSALTFLEVKGVISSLPGGYYLKN